MTARRRELLAGGAVAAAAAGAPGLPQPALAQAMAEVSWRLTSSFPKSIDTIYGVGEEFARSVARMTDGRFRIQVFAAGELVPGLQAADAVTNGTVEACHTASYYYVGKEPAFAFGTAIPFGMNVRGQNAWLDAGGNELLNEVYAKFNIHGIVAGNSGTQMGGWFRREIKTLADLQGLKMRIGGFAGQVLQKIGVVPQQIAPGDIYPALEKGTVDAAEWVGPYDDEKLGFYKVAPYYYYPGFWDGGPTLHVFVNRQKWDGLPPAYRAVLTAAGHEATVAMQARYDARNPPALKKLVANGAQLLPFPAEILDAARKAADEVYAETSAESEDFRRVFASYAAFQADQYLWWQVAEHAFDTFMIRSRTRG